ncbi:glycosyltransferase, partial [Candidatus Sumerlaeota bacterium]|nr:glycosyltransferase [Candidatus Sumerlaeota bacterium]
MPLKSLLLFSEDFRPAAGGIAEYLHQVCKHLALAGVATTVATTVAEKSDDDLPQPYIVRRLPPPFGPAAAGRRVNFLARPIRFLREQMAARAWSRQWLGKLRREHDPQVVALGVWSPLTDWWALNCLGNGIPFVYFVYGKELLPRLGGLKGLCYGRSRRRSLRRAGAAIAISHATASAAIRLGVSPSKIALAMPGIDLSEWPPVSAETCRDVAASFRLEGKRIILSVSRLAPRKGIATMLEA